MDDDVRELLIAEALRQARIGINPTMRGVCARVEKHSGSMYLRVGDRKAMIRATVIAAVQQAFDTEDCSLESPLNVSLPVAADALRACPGILPDLHHQFLTETQPMVNLLFSDDVSVEVTAAINATLLALVVQPRYADILDQLLPA